MLKQDVNNKGQCQSFHFNLHRCFLTLSDGFKFLYGCIFKSYSYDYLL